MLLHERAESEVSKFKKQSLYKIQQQNNIASGCRIRESLQIQAINLILMKLKTLF